MLLRDQNILLLLRPWILCSFLIVSANDLFSQLPSEKELLTQLDTTTNSRIRAELLSTLVAVTQVNDIAAAKKYALEALNISKKTNYKFIEGLTLNRHGMTFWNEGEYDSAAFYLEQSLPIFEALDTTKYILFYYINMGIVMSSYGKKDVALKMFFEALDIAKENGNQRLVASCYHNVAWIYNSEGMFEEAISHYQNALDVNTATGNSMSAARNLEGMGIIASKLGNYRQALSYFQASSEFAKEKKQNSLIRNNFSEMGLAYQRLNLLDSSLISFQESLKLFDENNPTTGMIFVYKHLANTYLVLSKVSNSIEYQNDMIFYTNKAWELAKQINGPDELLIAYRLKVTADSVSGKYQSALTNYFKYDSIKSVLSDENLREQIAELDTKYETQQKEQQIDTLARENEIAELRKNILILSIIAVVIIALMIYFQQRIRSKKNLELLDKGRELDHTKSKFFSHISHEFRTPLTLILGPLAELKSVMIDHPVQKQIARIERNSLRLLSLVNQILDLSMLRSNRVLLRMAYGDLTEFLKKITSSFDSLAESKHIKFQVNIDSPPIEGWFDSDSLEKIVNNLISNAFKFTSEGDAIQVEVQLTTYQEHRFLCLKFRDSGIGIKPDDQVKVFDEFFHTKNDQQPSTGIGLSLTKELVENSGGQIILENNNETGTVFIVTLPIDREYFDRKNIHYQIEEAKNNSDIIIEDSLHSEEQIALELQNSTSILIIEDNSEMRSFLVDILSQDYHVFTAKDGVEGISMAKELTPDLIVSDVMMPGIDGIELTKTLKGNLNTNHIPIILLTAKSQQEHKVQGLKAKADAYLTKPFDKNELLQIINNLIETRAEFQKQLAESLIFQKPTAPEDSLDKVFLQKVADVIENNLSNSLLSAEDISLSVGLSRSQVHRKLKALTGLSINKLIRTIRLKRAKELLQQNVGTVAEIAYLTGFNTPAYFNKCFTDEYGKPPGKMRGNTE